MRNELNATRQPILADQVIQAGYARLELRN
jgi:hypothetical protein